MSAPRRRPVAIALLGPTAAGKSAIALELAVHLPIEIISVDSALVFRDMDIGTAKPSMQERAAVPHHLIDIIEPTQSYSAANFVADASRLVDQICARGRIPVLVGGTMLYFRALREGLSVLPPADAATRNAIESAAAALGWPAMHAELALVDPITAARLKPTDAQRIQRALEVYRLTGRSISSLFHARSEPSMGFTLIQAGLAPSDRTVLHRRIEARFADMLERGLVDEVAAIRRRYSLHARLPAMRCVGYRQAWQFLEGALGKGELLNRGIFATRQLAKRQLTWMRSTPDLFTIDCLAHDAARQFRDWAQRRIAAD